MDAITYYLIIVLVWLLPVLAIVMSILTFHYTGINFLHWVAAMIWFIAGYYFFSTGMGHSNVMFQALGIVFGVLGMVMVFSPFFLSAKHEDTLVDDEDAVTRHSRQMESMRSKLGAYKSLRPKKRSMWDEPYE